MLSLRAKAVHPLFYVLRGSWRAERYTLFFMLELATPNLLITSKKIEKPLLDRIILERCLEQPRR